MWLRAGGKHTGRHGDQRAHVPSPRCRCRSPPSGSCSRRFLRRLAARKRNNTDMEREHAETHPGLSPTRRDHLPTPSSTRCSTTQQAAAALRTRLPRPPAPGMGTHRWRTCVSPCAAAAASRCGPSAWASSGSTPRPGTGRPVPRARARRT